jgi:hypothetical protein
MRRQVFWIGLTLGAGILTTLLVVYVRSYVDEPLRRIVERNVNRSLTGYTVRVGALKLHPFSLSLDLVDSQIFQDAHPDPPVAHLPRLHAGVHWRALLNGRLVGDFLIDRPKFYIDIRQAAQEIKDKTTLAERGWQDALQEIYPLKINVFRIRDAGITYVDEGPFKPLHLRAVNFQARNIRNVQSKKEIYPSDVYLEAIVFDAGKVVVDGRADFLSKPHMGIKANFSLKQVELDYFKPIIRRYHVTVRDGVLSTDGLFEYAPQIKVANLDHVTIQGVELEYVHQVRTRAAEMELGRAVARKARELQNHPDIRLRVDRVHVLKSRLAFVDKAAQPEYKIFFADTNVSLDNVGNQGADGAAVGTLEGKFMGSGPTVVNLAFQPTGKSMDFDVRIRVDRTDMKAMNNLWLAYGNFDVASGVFSLYSELAIRNGALNGYVKPLFRGLHVYDANQDMNKPFLTKLREGSISVLARLLSNRSRDEVGTTVTLSGQLDRPEFSNWEAFLGMVKNAFIKALTPGFEENPKTNNEQAKASHRESSGQSFSS